ncbi:MAG: hypothetical protein ACREDI_06445 [Roseiarcus sp.]
MRDFGAASGRDLAIEGLLLASVTALGGREDAAKLGEVDLGGRI